MMRKRTIRSTAILASLIASVFTPTTVPAQSEIAPVGLGDFRLPRLDLGRYPWRRGIVTTTFWIGEEPTRSNPTPNHISSWDKNWRESYGGTDHPAAAERVNFLPAKFTPKQNPFYAALPYNDCTLEGYKPEAERVIPWFKDGPQPGSKRSVLKGRWLAIRCGKRVAYAQWEDAGPFRTDHWQYVFGDERPKTNLNSGAGLDVSPAVRDFLGLKDTDVTDWKFVDLSEVPAGPWSELGDNNPFALKKRAEAEQLARLGRMKPLAVLLEENLAEVMVLGGRGLPLSVGRE